MDDGLTRVCPAGRRAGCHYSAVTAVDAVRVCDRRAESARSGRMVFQRDHTADSGGIALRRIQVFAQRAELGEVTL
jgi:hypothetical protein